MGSRLDKIESLEPEPERSSQSLTDRTTTLMSAKSKLVAFVKGARSALDKFRQSGGVALVVAGNESADLDSGASSLLTAYMAHTAFAKSLSPFSKEFRPVEVFPLFNIRREDLRLRPDIVHLFGKLGISESDLLFLDDIGSEHDWSSSHVFLVDHNVLVGDLSSMFGDRVAGILDHHADEHRYEQAIRAVGGPRIVKATGSCSSHVVNYWQGVLHGTDVFEDASLLELAMAPLVADTSNLRYRTEDPDRESMKILSRPGAPDPEMLMKELETHKRDIKGMSGRDLLRKDYKEWTESGGKVGISTIVQSLEWIYGEHKDFDSDVLDWAKENKLDVCAVMTTYHETSGEFRRELGVAATSSRGGALVDKFLDKSKATLGLERFDIGTSNMLVGFKQGNVAASRKQVAPLMREALL